MRYFRHIIIAALLLLPLGAAGQGNNTGLGGDDKDILSIGERLFNLEKKSEAFQFFLNMKTGYRETVAGDDVGGKFGGFYFRPEIKGTIGKWGYRVRVDMTKAGASKGIDGMLSSVNFMAAYFKPNEHWDFVFGRKALQYGTYENEWNSLKVVKFHEYFDNVPLYGVAFDANYTVSGNTFGVEIANASTNDLYTNYPEAESSIEKSPHAFQYTADWMGNLFNGLVRTKWSYTLFNQAKGCLTSQLALGTVFNLGKWSIQVDYAGAYGDLDHLGLITKDARTAGFITEDEIVRGTSYNSVTLDIGYWPTTRWNLYVKCGNCNSSAWNIEALKNYRKTYEYTCSAQYVLDPTQDLRVALSYVGKHVRFSPASLLERKDEGFIELSLIYRLKAF